MQLVVILHLCCGSGDYTLNKKVKNVVLIAQSLQR